MLEQIVHFASRGALDIEGLGEQRVAQLLQAGLITDVADLFALRVEDLSVLEGFGELSATSLVRAIGDAKTRAAESRAGGARPSTRGSGRRPRPRPTLSHLRVLLRAHRSRSWRDLTASGPSSPRPSISTAAKTRTVNAWPDSRVGIYAERAGRRRDDRGDAWAEKQSSSRGPFRATPEKRPRRPFSRGAAPHPDRSRRRPSASWWETRPGRPN